MFHNLIAQLGILLFYTFYFQILREKSRRQKIKGKLVNYKMIVCKQLYNIEKWKIHFYTLFANKWEKCMPNTETFTSMQVCY